MASDPNRFENKRLKPLTGFIRFKLKVSFSEDILNLVCINVISVKELAERTKIGAINFIKNNQAFDKAWRGEVKVSGENFRLLSKNEIKSTSIFLK